MANFNIAYAKLLNLEFTNPKKALHRNESESGYTFMGIYELFHPDWKYWQRAKTLLINHPITSVSSIMYNMEEVRDSIKEIYKEEYWNKLRADEITDQDLANTLFIFAVNVSAEVAIRKLQFTLNIKTDGILGKQTLSAISRFNPKEIIIKFKYSQLQYYDITIRNKPHLQIYKDGWINRVYNS